ncbi:unnamed protein product [Citrullus colocynthis]|uniref:Uncharacterized protein n=1 Tax=Citrullus colocynthis TaxID=252529 RepID=A0ABP0XM16_9ROSI
MEKKTTRRKAKLKIEEEYGIRELGWLHLRMGWRQFYRCGASGNLWASFYEPLLLCHSFLNSISPSTHLFSSH